MRFYFLHKTQESTERRFTADSLGPGKREHRSSTDTVHRGPGGARRLITVTVLGSPEYPARTFTVVSETGVK